MERVDRGGRQLLSVRRKPAVGKDASVDARMKRLDPAVEHLGKAGDRGDVRDREPGRPQRPGRTAGRNQLEAEPNEAGPEFGQARLVGDREQGPPRRGTSFGRKRGIDSNGSPVRINRQRAGQRQRNGPRQKSMFDRMNPLVESGLGVPRQNRYGLLGDDRAAVQRCVHEMDRHARNLDARGQSVGNAVRARERRQQRRMQIEDPAYKRVERRRPDNSHVPGQDHELRRDGRERLGQNPILVRARRGITFRCRRNEQRLDPLLDRPIERGTGPIGEDQHDLGVQRPA